MQYKMDELGEIRKRSGIAYHHQLYTLLSAALNEGLIAAGSALPSETELMGRFGISRNTVRRALGRLEQEKRIVRRRGSGSYARRGPQSELAANVAEVLEDFIGGKLHSTSRLIRVQSAPTPEFIRRKDPEFGDKSMLVQRCRSYKDEPFMFSTSYVPAIISARLTRRLLARQVVLTALEDLGSQSNSAEQITTAVAADTLAARHLGIEPASPLLCIHRLVRDKTGRSLEHQSHLFRPDRFQLRLTVTLDRNSSELGWTDANAPPMPAAL